MGLLCVLLFALFGGALPRFDRYPAASVLRGELAAPRLTNAEERRFRTVLRQGVAKGYGVVDGGTEHERAGVNFAGSYILVQWGCGSNCMEGALIDGRDGMVLRLPQISGEELAYFEIPTGSADLRTIKFRRDSRLLGIPRVANGETYYYVLDGRQWRFIAKARTPDGHP